MTFLLAPHPSPRSLDAPFSLVYRLISNRSDVNYRVVNHAMEGFDDAFYQAHYSLPDHQLGPPAYSNAHHPTPLMSYPSSEHIPPSSFAYPPPHVSSDLLAAGIPATFPSHPDDFSFQPPVHHGLHAPSHAASLGGHLSHAMHAYDPLSAPAHSIPMGLDQTNPFPYDATAFGASIGPLDPTLEQHSVPPHTHLPSQTIHLDPSAAYAVAQAPEPIANTYWNQPTSHDVTVQTQSTGPIPGPSGDFSRASGPSQEQSLPQSQPPEFQPYTQPANPAVPHRYIQPKRSSPVKGGSSSNPNPT